MAKAKKTAVSEMPEGFDEQTQSRVEGWFVREAGNSVQGIIKDMFEVKAKGKFGARKVYKIELTKGETKIMDGDGGETTASEGDLIGLDETGYLKKLAEVEKGSEVFVLCKGKESDAMQAPWIFKVGVRSVF